MHRTRYLLERLAATALLVLLVVSLTFVLLKLAPGEPTDRFDDPRIPAEQRARLHALYGFDRPLSEQYLRFLGAAARGEWGYSHLFALPAHRVVTRLLPASLLLGGCALVIGVALGLGLGVVAARTAGGVLDHGLRLLGLVLYAMPGFWLGLVGILVLAHRLRLLPSSGMTGPLYSQLSWAGRVLDIGHHLLLPALVLALPLGVEVGRFVRGGLLEAETAPFVLAARARGLPESRILGHSLRHALRPALQVLGLSAPALLGGAFVVEFVFAWPGLGRAAVDAVTAKDYALVLATTSVSAVLVVLGNLGSDLLLAWLDPRVRRA